MARRRNYAAEYARRQARARELGYSGYYERRTRRRPGGAKPPSELLSRIRGHRGRKDLQRELERGRVAVIMQVPDPASPRNADGTYDAILLDVQLQNGRTQSYRLRGHDLEGPRIADLRAAIVDAGTSIYVNPSLDILALGAEVDVVEEPGSEEEYEYEEMA